MTVTIEQREGRITVSEYRAVVTTVDGTAAGPWEFTKAAARKAVPGLAKSLFNVERAERALAANSADRMRRVRRTLEVDRRIEAPE